MATLDDKLMGEKLHYYCSSSSESEDEDEEKSPADDGAAEPSAPNGSCQWDGTSCNTGPKGVIRDYQRFKQLEREKREEQNDELQKLAKKFSITCRTNAEDEKAKSEEEKLEDELAKLMDETCMQEFFQQRMQEMLLREATRMRFGFVHVIDNCDHFLSSVDGEDKSVVIVILLHEPNSPGCFSAIKAIESLAKHYVHVKFCTVRPSLISMSVNFKVSGVPALIAYKAGQLIGNLVRMTDELGEEFETCDLESFLIEHGILNDRHLVPNGNKVVHESSDED
uniref:EOG090X08Y3 n=1 Tax=Daphnia dolichocephala TaxID=2282166 RepID=A0A4Y7M0S1_9CRUS|nr:EOG090X08Y3 [Daphnia dolichocephala]